MAEEAAISLGLGLLLGSSGLPGSLPARQGRSEQLLLPYLALLRVGFVVPPALLRER